MATRQEMSLFLASVQRRAFKQAVYAVRDDEAALDLVQDAMLKRKTTIIKARLDNRAFNSVSRRDKTVC